MDQPPFNFQGMLRKTNHKRASMKRSDAKLSLMSNIDIEGNNQLPGNVVFNSKQRPKSCELSVSDGGQGASTRKYSLQDTGASSKVDENANKSIAPGLVLEEEGFAADL